MTPDTWHLTCDIYIGHVSCDRQRVVNTVSKLRVPSSYGFRVKVFWRYLNKMISNLMNEWTNYKGVCRTAPATPSVLNICCYTVSIWTYCSWVEKSSNKIGVMVCKTVKILTSSSLNTCIKEWYRKTFKNIIFYSNV